MDLAPRLLIALVLFLAAAAPARADLVQLDSAHARSAFLQATDPFVPFEWWRPVVGADRAEPPGPGKQVTVVDSGVDLTHPEFAARPNTTVLNRQTTSQEDEDHGTEVSSVIAAQNNGVRDRGRLSRCRPEYLGRKPVRVSERGRRDRGDLRGGKLAARCDQSQLRRRGRRSAARRCDSVRLPLGLARRRSRGQRRARRQPAELPAFYPHVLTVGATNESDLVAGFLDPLARPSTWSRPACTSRWPSRRRQEPTGLRPCCERHELRVAARRRRRGLGLDARPDLDNTQLFELLRRSATDIGAPGFDNASGYGLLNIPKALAFKTPTRDPQEPNEKPRPRSNPTDCRRLERRRSRGPAHVAGFVGARVDRSEDPLDLYRVWSPAR